MPVTVPCNTCGATLQRPPSQVKPTNFCNRACQAKYASAHYVRDKALAWKGGIKFDHGRAMIYRPEHPHAQRGGYVYRYRLILEGVIGRLLRPDEIVHHINGDDTDDHPENLMALSQSEHQRIHHTGKQHTHCRKGHALTPENVYTTINKQTGRVQRQCKTCSLNNARERYQRISAGRHT